MPFRLQARISVLAATSGTMSITGTLLGLAVSWMGQSKIMLRDVDYDRAEELFNEIGKIQNELILRWGLILICSLLTVAISAALKEITDSSTTPVTGILVACNVAAAAAVAFVVIGVFYVGYIFFSMIAVQGLKIKLDRYERDEFRKQRNAK